MIKLNDLLNEAIQIATDYQFSPEQYNVLKKFGAKLHLNGRELLIPARIYDDLEKHASKSDFKQAFYKTVKNIGGESMISQILTALKQSLSSGNTANIEGKTYYVLQGKLTKNGNFNFPNPSRTGGAIAKTKFQDTEPEPEPEDIANVPKKYNKWTPEKLEQEAAKYSTSSEFKKANVTVYNIYRTAVRKGIIQNKFKTKWNKDTLEQEAAKYTSASEFKQNSPSAYVTYMMAVRNGLIQNKFEARKYEKKWTKDALEQEVTKYNTSTEFKQNNNSAYQAYVNAVKKGLIQNKFKPTGFGKKWTKDALEQEANKYDTAGEFIKANVTVYNIYRTAVRKGIIKDKFKQDKTIPAGPSTTTPQPTNTTQPSNVYNSPYFTSTTTFDKLKEGQFINEVKRLQKLAGILKENK